MLATTQDYTLARGGLAWWVSAEDCVLARPVFCCTMDTRTTFLRALARRTLLKMMASLCRLCFFRTSKTLFSLFVSSCAPGSLHVFGWTLRIRFLNAIPCIENLPSPTLNVFQRCDLVRPECSCLVLFPAVLCKVISFFVII